MLQIAPKKLSLSAETIRNLRGVTTVRQRGYHMLPTGNGCTKDTENLCETNDPQCNSANSVCGLCTSEWAGCQTETPECGITGSNFTDFCG